MEAQAIGPAHRYVQADGEPAVWQVMITIGDFWLVEHGGVVELFLATVVGGAPRASTSYRFPNQAARRFLELHLSV